MYNHGVLVKSYHTDNVLSSKEFEDKILKGSQSITFSIVGLQHQNGVAEQAICMVAKRV